MIGSLEGDIIAIYSSRPTLTLFAIDTALYTELPPRREWSSSSPSATEAKSRCSPSARA